MSSCCIRGQSWRKGSRRRCAPTLPSRRPISGVPEMADAMLEITGLHAHYGLSHVLQGIDLRGAAGEVVGIFGRNGVGKTTIIKAIAGWVPPSAGSILL